MILGGDVPMLNLASKSLYVGYDLAADLILAEHWPDADIDKIVSIVLA